MATVLEAFAEAVRVFTPGAPISRRDCFSGRTTQIERVIECIISPGQHPIIYGQRGVGKTSLANVLGEMFQDGLATKVSCDGGDTFQSIWNRLLRDASVEFKRQAWGFSAEEVAEKYSLASFLGQANADVRPSDVGMILKHVKRLGMFVLDEFDKVSDTNTKAYMADLIKMVSDNTTNVTIVIVGVSDSIQALIGEHPSIERNLVQVELPTMPVEDIESIVREGWERLSLTFEEAAVHEVGTLANGFPHYAHLLVPFPVRQLRVPTNCI